MESNMLEFMVLIGKLKRVKRTGWLRRNIQDAESVADHMHRMGVLALLLDKNRTQGLNRDKCVKMALIHDLAESIVGDITPHCGISKEEKFSKEEEAMKHITSLLDKDTGKEILQLWQEFEEHKTSEAKAVKDLDRFDMILQAYEYESLLKRPMELQEFFDSTEGKFENPEVKEWVEELTALRSTNKQYETLQVPQSS